MPERSFGRVVRYRRTKAGLSQSRLGELVGRSASTIRSWERDESMPGGPEVVSALAAVLDLDERTLLEKAGFDLPETETEPTVEEALRSLSPPSVEPAPEESDSLSSTAAGELERPEPPAVVVSLTIPTAPAEPEMTSEPIPAHSSPAAPRPGFHAAGPNAAELSYVEDEQQRQVYRVRALATLVVFVALVVVLVWAMSNGVAALGEWWDHFVGQLRL